MKGRAFINEKFPVCSSPSHPPFGWESGEGVDTQHTLADVRAGCNYEANVHNCPSSVLKSQLRRRYVSAKRFPFGRLAAIHSLKSPCKLPCQALADLGGVFLPPLLSTVLSNAESW